ncbi:MAG: hypothetical protein NTW87_20395 [Planctomycetota bacterium]|nr:hypothetical protein [Planctomycetota bacterium]
MPDSEPPTAGDDDPSRDREGAVPGRLVDARGSDAPHPDAALAAWYLRDRHRRVWRLPITVALVIFVAVLLVRGTADDPKAHLEASRAALLALAPPDVPAAENAALDYARAHKAKVAFPRAPGKQQWPDDPHVNVTKETALLDFPQVHAYLASNASAIQLLYAGAAKPRCNWGLNYALGPAIPMAHLASTRDSARLLAIHARLAAHAGDHQAAARSIAAIYRLADQCAVDPLLINGLVSVACAAIADGTLEAIVTWDMPASLDDLAAYRKALWLDRRGWARAARSLAAEKAFCLFILDSVTAGVIPAPVQAPGLGTGLEFLAPDKGGAIWYGAERSCYVAVIDELVDRTARGECLSEEQAKALVAKHQAGPAIMTFTDMPVFTRCVLNFLANEDRGVVTDAGLAFLQFRLKHGRDPKSLDELVPEFLPAVPTGVFHPSPLRMKVDPEGVRVKDRKTGKVSHRDPGTIRVYTLGLNNTDDGGLNHIWDDELPAPTLGDDVGFRVPPIRTSGPAAGGTQP